MTNVLKEFEYKGRKCVILWINYHYCAYGETKLSISYSHNIQNKKIEIKDTSPKSKIDCHGGITFGAGCLSISKRLFFNENIKFFGIDFAHCGDFVDYMGEFNIKNVPTDQHRWTEQEVIEETKKLIDGIIKYENYYAKKVKKLK